jgi:hypothetical protein
MKTTAKTALVFLCTFATCLAVIPVAIKSTGVKDPFAAGQKAALPVFAITIAVTALAYREFRKREIPCPPPLPTSQPAMGASSRAGSQTSIDRVDPEHRAP